MPQDKSVSGRFAWAEVGTHDVRRCRDFYSQLLGWTPTDMTMSGGAYTMFSTKTGPVAGLYRLAPDQPSGTQPHWLNYIAVDNVDQSFERVHQLGGFCLVPPTDIPGVGRHAVVRDPTGASFALFTSLEAMERARKSAAKGGTRAGKGARAKTPAKAGKVTVPGKAGSRAARGKAGRTRAAAAAKSKPKAKAARPKANAARPKAKVVRRPSRRA